MAPLDSTDEAILARLLALNGKRVGRGTAAAMLGAAGDVGEE